MASAAQAGATFVIKNSGGTMVFGPARLAQISAPGVETGESTTVYPYFGALAEFH